VVTRLPFDCFRPLGRLPSDDDFFDHAKVAADHAVLPISDNVRRNQGLLLAFSLKRDVVWRPRDAIGQWRGSDERY
jgi:hypothetical protein